MKLDLRILNRIKPSFIKQDISKKVLPISLGWTSGNFYGYCYQFSGLPDSLKKSINFLSIENDLKKSSSIKVAVICKLQITLRSYQLSPDLHLFLRIVEIIFQVKPPQFFDHLKDFHIHPNRRHLHLHHL